jgi:hypothetical protein
VVTTSEVRSLARVTLANFGAVLFVAIFMVIPRIGRWPACRSLAPVLSALASPHPA